MVFNFGQSFLDQMNQGHANRLSREELSLLAQQIQDELANNALNREALCAGMTHDHEMLDLQKSDAPVECGSFRGY